MTKNILIPEECEDQYQFKFHFCTVPYKLQVVRGRHTSQNLTIFQYEKSSFKHSDNKLLVTQDYLPKMIECPYAHWSKNIILYFQCLNPQKNSNLFQKLGKPKFAGIYLPLPNYPIIFGVPFDLDMNKHNSYDIARCSNVRLYAEKRIDMFTLETCYNKQILDNILNH